MLPKYCGMTPFVQVAVGASMGPLADLPGLGGPPSFGGPAAPAPQPISVEERLQAYAPILEGVRKVMILKMVKPPEVHRTTPSNPTAERSPYGEFLPYVVVFE